MKKTAKTHRKITIKAALQQLAGKTPKAPKAYPHYTGAPISATPGQVFKREMPEFKNSTAFCWLLINRTAGTYCFANTYGGDRLKASFRPEIYTYAIKGEKTEKKLAAKVAEMMEVPAEEWPEWITPAIKPVASPASRSRGRK